MKKPPTLVSIAILILLVFTGCATAYKESLGKDTQRTLTRLYLTDFNTCWQSTLEALKKNRLDISNREGGMILTKWSDNTADKNLVDSFGAADAYLKAQSRFKVTLSKGFYNGRAAIKVTVLREQLIQKDVLEGWKPTPTDGIEENTLLYRIGRLIAIKLKMTKLEEQKADAAAKELNPNGDSNLPDASSNDELDSL